ncbi:hypothetical protein BMF94_2511 [Rhodotorula taiwanensis]|uniref:ATP12-domain-containing protein n=1 Tax=Rhodotorula taiwanensis TaxID=741276 RepID=A0A2S5BC31_9BASI|nr:hypothetical protein BMF94_2511 [Rhodotorula taiwanensis]
MLRALVPRRLLARPATSAAACARCCFSSSTRVQEAATSQTDQAEKQMRRFWKTVGLEVKPQGDYAVLLDKRTLKTPGGAPLTVPKGRLPVALCIADEWENQTAVLKPHTLPMTSITSRALDGLQNPDMRKDVVAYLLRYLDTDTVCFHESFPDRLVALQDAHWKPLIDWVEKTYSVKIELYDSILNTRQPDATVLKLGSVVSDFDHFKLAAFERAVLASKSYLIALSLVEGYFSVDEAAKAAHVEVQSQIDRWGEVEDTHDVDHQDVRVRLGAAALLVAEQPQLA